MTTPFFFSNSDANLPFEQVLEMMRTGKIGRLEVTFKASNTEDPVTYEGRCVPKEGQWDEVREKFGENI